jgi:uncharacterized membrane-anchored protein
MEQTLKPWYSKPDTVCPDLVMIFSADDKFITFAEPLIALRIVACVNACEGINPEAVPDLLETLQDVLLTGGDTLRHWGNAAQKAAHATMLERVRSSRAKATGQEG